MPPVFSALHNPVAHGPFRPVTPLLDAIGAERVIATDTNGVYHAYRMRDGRIQCESLVTPSQAKIDADAAADAAVGAAQTAYNAALLIIRNQVARVRAIPPASRTDSDRWCLALSRVLLKEE